MAFFITSNGNIETLLTDGSSIKVGNNLEVKNGYLNALGGGGTGNLDNVRVNNILGEVTDKISELTLTGADIKITGYEES